jgi:hypothetical protein
VLIDARRAELQLRHSSALVRRLLVCWSACRELCDCRQEPLQVQGELWAGWLGAGQLFGVSHLVHQRVDVVRQPPYSPAAMAVSGVQNSYPKSMSQTKLHGRVLRPSFHEPPARLRRTSHHPTRTLKVGAGRSSLEPTLACIAGHSGGHSTRPYCSQPDRTQRNAFST